MEFSVRKLLTGSWEDEGAADSQCTCLLPWKDNTETGCDKPPTREKCGKCGKPRI